MDPMCAAVYSGGVAVECGSLALHSPFAQSITQTRHVNTHDLLARSCLASGASAVDCVAGSCVQYPTDVVTEGN
jgi:hypothetical protein